MGEAGGEVDLGDGEPGVPPVRMVSVCSQHEGEKLDYSPTSSQQNRCTRVVSQSRKWNHIYQLLPTMHVRPGTLGQFN